MKRMSSLIVVMAILTTPIFAQTFSTQGFEVDNAGWNIFGGSLNATRVASGTNGITSSAGSFHAEVATGATNWGGYGLVPGCASTACAAGNVFPANGYITSVDVYLDLTATTTNDKRFDFTSAINTPAGAHRRDFAFNGGFYNDSDGTGSGPRFVFSASNNTGRANSFPKNPGRDPFAITATGWYTFQHKFYDAGGGVLAVDLKIIDASNATLKTWTLSDPTDIIGTTVGANRYGWFAANEFTFLAIDNATLIKIQSAPECGDFVFLAEDEIFLDRHGVSEGNIHANNDIVIRKGAPSTLSGNLTAVDNIRIQTKNTINGEVTAGGEVDSDVSVNGAVTEHAAVSAVSLPNPSFSAGGANHTIPQNGSLNLAPGTYGIVMVGKNATLNLSSGEYFFTMLDAKQGADLAIDVSGGEVAINVVSKLTFGKQSEVVISSGEAGSSEVTFTSLQSSQLVIGEKAKVLGSIIAPEATVMLSKNSRFRGSICADQVKVSKAAVFLHHSSAGSLPRIFDAPDLEDVEAEVMTTVVTDYALSANYPNPFNPSTTIKFALPEAGRVTLRIYSLTGQLVRELVHGDYASGRHQVRWDARDAQGQQVASGVYFYRLAVQNQTGQSSFTQTRQMVFVK